MRVFLALPEPALPEGIANTLATSATNAGHEPLPAMPDFHAGVTQSERNRFLTAVDRMMEAELLIADVSDENHSVAWCIAWFLARGRLVVLTCRRDRRATLSPMLAGNPSPWQRLVLYDDATDLRANLEKALAF